MSIMQEKYACTPSEFVLKYSLIYLGMKKTANDEIIDKIKANEDNSEALKKFCSDQEFFMFLFAVPAGTGISFKTEAPSPD